MTDSEIPDPHARPGSDTPPVNGDEVRDTWFLRSSIWRSYGGGFIGYAASEVDDLLRRVAAELDAGGGSAAVAHLQYRTRAPCWDGARCVTICREERNT